MTALVVHSRHHGEAGKAARVDISLVEKNSNPFDSHERENVVCPRLFTADKILFVKRMKKTNCLALALFLLTTPTLAGDDKSGTYIVAGGVGGVDCPRFTSTMSKAKAKGVGSVAYANETYGFTMYVLGFQTAYNVQTKDTCDIFGNFTTDQLLAWLDNYCQVNPLQKFGSAVIALAQEVHSKRVRICR